MTKAIILSKDDYNAVLAQLNDARVVCAEAQAAKFTDIRTTYFITEIDRRLESIQGILKRGESL